jgi:hypothetical protein
MTEKRKTTRARRPYHKPQLEQVQLVAEEAVLQGCKRGSDSGPSGKGCKDKNVNCSAHLS